MGPVAQLVFKTSAVVQPTARSVRLRRRSVEPKHLALTGAQVAGTLAERWAKRKAREAGGGSEE
jgi:hypothetical protein